MTLQRCTLLLMVLFLLLPEGLQANTLTLLPAKPSCDVPALAGVTLAAATKQRLAQSQPTSGRRDIAWVWLGSPTSRYPHAALGSTVHAASLQVLTAADQGQLLTYKLPLRRVFEDRVPRLTDLDGDGRDEIIVVEADALQGAALVVFGLRDGALVELARGPRAGSTFRWLNPVGVADFDGDGRLDVASVTTPHIGGVLTLHHYRPPRLEPYARFADVSNHRMGELEQKLAVIVTPAGQRPAILIPDMQLQALGRAGPTAGAASPRRALHAAGGRGLPSPGRRELVARGADALTPKFRPNFGLSSRR
jgi:hypothetical protein